MLEFLIKAAREAKTDSSWINPNETYEKALEAFLDGLLTGRGSARFLAALSPFIKTVAPLGMLRSLSQLALKCGLPGVPDIYQGTEYWDLSLVDPDNRRPVDYSIRILPWIKWNPGSLPDSRVRIWAEESGPWACWAAGRTAKSSNTLRPGPCDGAKQHADLFLNGGYRPLFPDFGAKSGWIAFAREWEGKILIVCVRILGTGTDRPMPTWTAAPGAAGERLSLPREWDAGKWINLFTGTHFTAHAENEGSKLELAEIGRDFPIAWLIPAIA